MLLLGVLALTASRWRHKLLAYLGAAEQARLSGIVEMDEMYFLHLQKGERTLKRRPRRRGGRDSKRGLSRQQVCVAVARDRSKHTLSESDADDLRLVFGHSKHKRPELTQFMYGLAGAMYFTRIGFCEFIQRSPDRVVTHVCCSNAEPQLLAHAHATKRAPAGECLDQGLEPEARGQGALAI